MPRFQVTCDHEIDPHGQPYTCEVEADSHEHAHTLIDSWKCLGDHHVNGEPPRRRARFVVEVNLDDMPGAFHEPEDALARVAAILTSQISHYRPTVNHASRTQ